MIRNTKLSFRSLAILSFCAFRVFLWFRTDLPSTASLRGLSVPSSSSSSSILCLISQGDELIQDPITGERRHQEFQECTPYLQDEDTLSDLSYQVTLPEALLLDNEAKLHQGTLFLDIPFAVIQDDSWIVYPASVEPIVVEAPFDYQDRRLTTTTGTRTLLMVRITTQDAQPSPTAAQLSQHTLDPNQFSAASQVRACSFAQLELEPVPDSDVVHNGVVEVSIPLNAADSNRVQLMNAANVAARQTLGVSTLPSVADHVLYCMPPGTGTWIAAALLNSWLSIYNDDWCIYPSALIHELGHNWGLGHANENGSEYGDRTGYMGISHDSTTFPKMCFNGHNHHHLGWYQDHSLTRNVQQQPTPQLVKVAAFVDYNAITAADEYAIVQLVDKDIYLQYNRKKGINKDTDEYANALTVTQHYPTGPYTSVLAALQSTYNPRYEMIEPDGSIGLVIEVCSQQYGSAPDLMTVSIGMGSSICNHNAPAPPQQQVEPEVEVLEIVPAPTPSPTTPSPTTASPFSAAPSESTSPSMAPSLSVAPTNPLADTGQICDDHPTNTFFVNNTVAGETLEEHKTCIWLRARPQWQQVLCVDGNDAMTVCPEVCGQCVDACDDDPSATFLVNGSTRNCMWLSLRPTLWPTVCAPDSIPYASCGETCNSCVDASQNEDGEGAI